MSAESSIRPSERRALARTARRPRAGRRPRIAGRDEGPPQVAEPGPQGRRPIASPPRRTRGSSPSSGSRATRSGCSTGPRRARSGPLTWSRSIRPFPTSTQRSRRIRVRFRFPGEGHRPREKRDYDGALADCDEAIRLDPKNAWAYCDAWRRPGEEARERKGVGRHQRGRPPGPQGLRSSCRFAVTLYVHQKQFEQALADADAVDPARPEMPRWLHRPGRRVELEARV